MNLMSVIWKFLMALLRDFANGQIDPDWKAKQEQQQRDAAAFQRQAQVTKAEITEIDKHEAVTEQNRVTENERIDKADSLKDLWFPKP